MRARTAAGIVIALLVTAAAIAPLVANFPERENGSAPNCASASHYLQAATVKLSIRLMNDAHSVPRLEAILEVSFSSRQFAALAGALSSPSDDGFPPHVDCAIGVGDSGVYGSGTRIAEPSVTAQRDTVVVSDRQHVDVGRLGDLPQATYARLRELASERWKLDVTLPHSLRNSRSISVEIVAPAGWLRSPSSPGVNFADDTRVVWQFNRSQPFLFADIELSPDTRSVATAVSYDAGWYELSSATYFLPGPVILAIVLVYFRRHFIGAPGLPNRQTKRLGGVILGLLLLSTWIFIIGMIGLVCNYFAERSGNALVGTIDDAVANLLAVLIVTALAARTTNRPLGPILLGTVTLSFMTWRLAAQYNLYAAHSLVPFILARYESSFTTTAVALLSSTLTLGALIQVLVLVVRRGLPSSAVLPWVTSAALAVYFVLEALAGALYGAYESNLFYGTEFDLGIWPLEGLFPDLLLYNAGPFLHLIALAALLQVARHNMQPRGSSARDRQIRGIATLMFVIGPMPWSVEIWGWNAPITLALGGVIAIIVYRRLRSILDISPRPGAARLGDRVSSVSLATLRDEMREWQAKLQEGRSLERSVEAGDKSASDYMVRSRGLTAELNALAPDVSPVDIVFAIGPNRAPQANALHALRAALPMACIGAISLVAAYYVTNPTARYGYISPNAIIGDAALHFSRLALGVLSIGLMWHHLPGRRGILKVLPIGLLLAVIVFAHNILADILDEPWPMSENVHFFVFLALATATGIGVDFITLRLASAPWVKRLRLFLTMYGLVNLPTQLTFILAQLAAVLAIVSFVWSGGEPPSYPSIDPFQMSGRDP